MSVSRSSAAGPVLDYASPSAHGRVRLPAQSRIEIRREGDSVIVSEWLEAKTRAVLAIALAVATLIMLPLVYYLEDRPQPWRVSANEHPADLLVIAGVWLAELTVMLMVINNTWQRTVLEARARRLLLTFRAPFGKRVHEWPAGNLEDIRMHATTKLSDRNHLAEVRILIPAQPMVRLFTDHPATELAPIAAALRSAVGLTEPRRAQPLGPDLSSISID